MERAFSGILTAIDLASGSVLSALAASPRADHLSPQLSSHSYSGPRRIATTDDEY